MTAEGPAEVELDAEEPMRDPKAGQYENAPPKVRELILRQAIRGAFRRRYFFWVRSFEVQGPASDEARHGALESTIQRIRERWAAEGVHRGTSRVGA